MKWFGRVRRKNVRQTCEGREDEVSFKIAGKVLNAQRRVADYLNAKASGISSRGMLILLIGFVTLFGAYCLYLICVTLADWF